MVKHASPEAILAVELLAACRLARRAGLPAVGEHVLCALEELVRAAPAQRPALEAAYLEFGTARQDRGGTLQ